MALFRQLNTTLVLLCILEAINKLGHKCEEVVYGMIANYKLEQI